MIQNAEIEQKAKEFQINTSNLQRDYVFGWLLSGIFTQSPLGNKFILKGGNALRKAYLKNTRFSKDLDFSVLDAVDPMLLSRQLNDICSFVQDRTGVRFELDKTRIEEKPVFDKEQRQVFEARLYFNGFYGTGEILLKVQLDVTAFDKLFLPVQTRKLIHPYSDADACIADIQCQKLEEILASKLNAILQRGKVSDLFDLLFGNNEFQANKLEVISTFLKKTIYESSPHTAKEMLMNVPVEEYRPFWKDIIAPIFSIFDFDTAILQFKELVNILFNLIPVPAFAAPRISHPARYGSYGGYPSFSYFSSNTRDTIIAAGRARTMIELVYDGYSRFIEPYSFEYRIRKKDGAGMEYFWGWDTSGGKSGKTGIKMFINDKIQSVSPTDISFNPRYQVEL